ncbi:MAG: glycosyltransferase involved in cell wall biosynthesis [Psychroserpens sp.]|jgi:glycosyltransferase involved in cell wall biosynthesis
MIEKLVAPDSEFEIHKNWQKSDSVYISCVCTTYNQEAYIADAIDSFLAQKTEYRFEIIIHDDASTDNTRVILEEYKTKYPNIIRLILQDDNQYSKGNFRPFIYAASFAKGEYIAICEGDDFWINADKLQLQANELMLHKTLNLCFHSSLQMYNDNAYSGPKYTGGSKINCSELIISDFNLCASASMMIRKCVFFDLEFLNRMSVGDFYLRILAAQNGAIYLDNEMCAYRVNSQGSWSERNKNNIQKETDFTFSFYNELKEFDIYLDSKYQKEFSSLRLRLLVGFIRKSNIPLSYRTDIYHLDEKLSIIVKVLWYLIYSRWYYSRLYSFGRYIKSFLKQRDGV